MYIYSSFLLALIWLPRTAHTFSYPSPPRSSQAFIFTRFSLFLTLHISRTVSYFSSFFPRIFSCIFLPASFLTGSSAFSFQKFPSVTFSVTLSPFFSSPFSLYIPTSIFLAISLSLFRHFSLLLPYTFAVIFSGHFPRHFSFLLAFFSHISNTTLPLPLSPFPFPTMLCFFLTQPFNTTFSSHFSNPL